MGKEWLFWGGGKSTRKGKSGGEVEREAAAPTGCMCAVLQLFDMHHLQFALHQQPPFKSGSFLRDEPFVGKGLEAPRNSLELEKPFMEASAVSLSSTTMKQQEENLNIPVNIQIKTSCESKSPRISTSKARMDDLFSQCSSSSPAGAKTPTLVARLMGLDQLPEGTGSPSLQSTLNSLTSLNMHPHGQSHQRPENSSVARQFIQIRSCSNSSFFDNDITGTLSLPETPRISSARRSDVDHRLSLQINKENIGEEFDFSAYAAKKFARRREFKQEDENARRGSHYARQIVKQVKESVSRKVGLDITNTIKNREQRRDDQLVLPKPNKPSKILTRLGDEFSPGKQAIPSYSPRLLNPKNKPVTKNQTTHSPRFSSPLPPSPECQSLRQGKVLSKPKPQVPIFQEQKNHQQNSLVKKCKKDESEKYSTHIRKILQVSDAIRKKKEEPFVRSTTNKGNIPDKKCKKTSLSNELLNISVPTLLPVKKETHFPGTKLGGPKQSQASEAESLERSTQLSSCSSHSYKQKQQQQMTRTLTFQENIPDRSYNGISTSDVLVVEYQYYIQRILKRTGIDHSTPVSMAKWYSPSHPLDPSIFRYIELFHPTNTVTPSAISRVRISKLDLRCNRKLVFQLVDELLADILKPYFCLMPCWVTRPRGQMYGSELIEILCSRIKNFPSADCQVLEDIDALIDTDLRSKSSWVFACQEGEGEGIVSDIEREIVESLVHETTMEVAYG